MLITGHRPVFFYFIQADLCYTERMIALVEGTVELKGEKFVIIRVGEIGYRIFCGADTLQKMSERGGHVKLWTHHHVREDSEDLYGFLHYAELEFFEMLLTIPGIGPRGGLGILGVAPVDTLKRAIAAGDTSYLTRVSGVGRKTAEKIVLELKDKMAGKGVTIEAPELQEEADVLDTLMALGYSQREAREALAQVPSDMPNVGQRIKAALGHLGRK